MAYMPPPILTRRQALPPPPPPPPPLGEEDDETARALQLALLEMEARRRLRQRQREDELAAEAGLAAQPGLAQPPEAGVSAEPAMSPSSRRGGFPLDETAPLSTVTAMPNLVTPRDTLDWEASQRLQQEQRQRDGSIPARLTQIARGIAALPAAAREAAPFGEHLVKTVMGQENPLLGNLRQFFGTPPAATTGMSPLTGRAGPSETAEFLRTLPPFVKEAANAAIKADVALSGNLRPEAWPQREAERKASPLDWLNAIPPIAGPAIPMARNVPAWMRLAAGLAGQEIDTAADAAARLGARAGGTIEDALRAVEESKAGQFLKSEEGGVRLPGGVEASTLPSQIGNRSAAYPGTPEFEALTSQKYKPSSMVNDTRVLGTYHGKPAWSNGFILEVSPEPARDVTRLKMWQTPKTRDASGVNLDAQVKETGRPADVIATMTGTNAKAAPWVVLSDGSDLAPVEAEYYRYFAQRYPNATFHMIDVSAPIIVRNSSGDVVGAIMPMYAKDNEFIQYLKNVELTKQAGPSPVSEEVRAGSERVRQQQARQRQETINTLIQRIATPGIDADARKRLASVLTKEEAANLLEGYGRADAEFLRDPGNPALASQEVRDQIKQALYDAHPDLVPAAEAPPVAPAGPAATPVTSPGERAADAARAGEPPAVPPAAAPGGGPTPPVETPPAPSLIRVINRSTIERPNDIDMVGRGAGAGAPPTIKQKGSFAGRDGTPEGEWFIYDRLPGVRSNPGEGKYVAVNVKTGEQSDLFEKRAGALEWARQPRSEPLPGPPSETAPPVTSEPPSVPPAAIPEAPPPPSGTAVTAGRAASDSGGIPAGPVAAQPPSTGAGGQGQPETEGGAFFNTFGYKLRERPDTPAELKPLSGSPLSIADQEITYLEQRDTIDGYTRALARVSQDVDAAKDRLMALPVGRWRDDDMFDATATWASYGKAVRELERDGGDPLIIAGMQRQMRELIVHAGKAGTEAGRAVQAMSLLMRLAPESIVPMLAKEWAQLGKVNRTPAARAAAKIFREGGPAEGAAGRAGSRIERQGKAKIQESIQKQRTLKEETAKADAEADAPAGPQAPVESARSKAARRKVQKTLDALEEETGGPPRAPGMLERFGIFSRNEGRSPLAAPADPNSPVAILARLRRLMQSTGWDMPFDESEDIIAFGKHVQTLPAAERKSAVEEYVLELQSKYEPLLLERKDAFDLSMRRVKAVEKGMNAINALYLPPNKFTPADTRLIQKTVADAKRAGYLLTTEEWDNLTGIMEMIRGAAAGLAPESGRLATDSSRRLVGMFTDLGGKIQERQQLLDAANRYSSTLERAARSLADGAGSAKPGAIAPEEERILNGLVSIGRDIYYLLPKEMLDETVRLITAASAAKGRPAGVTALRDLRKHFIEEVAPLVEARAVEFEKTKKVDTSAVSGAKLQTPVPEVIQRINEARERAALLRYLTDKEARVIRPSIESSYKELVNSIRRAARESGVDVPEPLAEYMIRESRAVSDLDEAIAAASTEAERKRLLIEKYYKEQDVAGVIRSIAPPGDWGKLTAAYEFSRTALARFDDSAVLNQAFVAGQMHPQAWARATRNGLAALMDHDTARRLQAEMATHPDFQSFKDAGGHFRNISGEGVTREDPFIGTDNPATQGWRRVFGTGMSEDAMAVTLNKLAMDIYAGQLDRWRQMGYTPTADDLKAWASWANATTGYGTLPRAMTGLPAAARTAATLGLFSARLTVADPEVLFRGVKAAISMVPGSQQLLGTSGRLGVYSRPVAVAIARDMGAYTLSQTAILSAAALYASAAGGKVVMDWHDGDFGSYVNGDHKVGLLGSQANLVRALVELGSGYRTTSTGSKQDTEAYETVGNYLWGKAHPTLKTVTGLITGRDAIGRPVYGPARKDSLVSQTGLNELADKLGLSELTGDQGQAVSFLLGSVIPLVGQAFVDALHSNLGYHGALAGSAYTAAETVFSGLGGRSTHNENLGRIQERLARTEYPGEYFGAFLKANEPEGTDRPFDYLDDAIRRNIMQHPEAQGYLESFKQPDDPRQAQAVRSRDYETSIKAEEDELAARLGAPKVTGKAKREMIQDHLTARTKIAGATIGSEAARALKKERTVAPQKKDELADRYNAIRMKYDEQDGEPEFEDYKKEQQAVIAEARKAVDAGEMKPGDILYILSNKGKRAERFTNPVVKKEMEQWDKDKATLEAYWEKRDQVARAGPWAALIRTYDAAPAADRIAMKAKWTPAQKTQFNAFTKAVTDARHKLRAASGGKNPVEEAILRWGYSTTPIAKIMAGKSASSPRGGTGPGASGR